MRGKMTSERGLARAALAAVAAGLLFCAACGDDELVTRASRWLEVAPLPEGVRTFHGITVASDGAFYGAATFRADSFSDPYGVIYRCDGRTLKEVFRAPYERSGFGAIGARGTVLWAVGSKLVDKDYRPYVVRYAGGRWEEIDVPPEIAGPSFNVAYPVGEGFCWFKGERGIFTYNDGVWRTAIDLTDSHGADDFFVTAGGRAFFVAPPLKHNPLGAAAIKLFVSDDRGGSWHEEKISSPGPTRPFYSSWVVLRAGGECVYARTRLLLPHAQSKNHNANTLVIFRRDEAPAGRGTYHVVFESPKADYFGDVSAMAFRSPEEGYAVGPYTSVALEDGEWYVEAWEKYFSPYFEEVAAGPSGYWAIGMPAYQQPRRLYHAP